MLTVLCLSSVPNLVQICDWIPQNESEVAAGEIEKTSRKGGFPDFWRF